MEKITSALSGTFSKVDALKGNLANEVLRGYSAYQVAVFNGFEGTEEEWLDSLNGGNIDFSIYALKEDIPTDYAKEVHEHEQYLTEHQSLEDYAKKADIPTDYAKEEHTHEEYLTEIPSEYVTETKLEEKGYLTEHQDLSGYAKKTDIPTDYAKENHKHSEYLTEHQDLSNYAKKTDIPTDYAKEKHSHTEYADKEHTHSQYLTEHQSLEEYAKKVDIPTDYAKKEHTHDQYLTQHQDLSSYAKKTDVTTHNTSNSSHNDIRLLIEGLTTRLNALANSDDTTLDQMAEVVAYIKNNKTLIDNITTNKVNVSDIIDNLTTSVANKPLSAKQGVALKGLIDALTSVVDGKSPKEHTHSQYLTEHQDLSSYALKTSIPTKVSQLTNDSGYVDKNTSVLTNYFNIESSNSIYLRKGDAETTYATKESSATKQSLEALSDQVMSLEDDMRDIESSIPTKVSQLTNDSKYLTSIPSEYITESELTAKGYQTVTSADSKYQTKGNYLTSIPSNYVTETELSTAISNRSTVSYGTCETIASTAEKVVIIDDENWELTVGTVVLVYFTTSNTASNVKLNVNGTGAYPIWYNNAEYTSTGTGYTGYAQRVINYMFNGTHWVWIGSSYDSNTTYTNVKLGHGYATCATAEATVAKVGTLSSYTLTVGGIVAVKFTYGVPANATLNINSRGAKKMFYRGSAITAGVIKAGDTATFIYDGTQYQLLSIDNLTTEEWTFTLEDGSTVTKKVVVA